MRSQTWKLVPWKQREEFVNDRHGYDMCRHTFYRHWISMRELVSSTVERLEAGKKCSTETSQCPYCWMDYVVDAKNFGERGFALILTRWTNLGAGIDSEDPKWQSHVGYRSYADDPHPHSLGAIRASFEGDADISVEALTASNELKLFSRRPTPLFRRGSDGLVWNSLWGTWWYLAPSGPPAKGFGKIR